MRLDERTSAEWLVARRLEWVTRFLESDAGWAIRFTER